VEFVSGEVEMMIGTVVPVAGSGEEMGLVPVAFSRGEGSGPLVEL
jgi:hypothetical protein